MFTQQHFQQQLLQLQHLLQQQQQQQQQQQAQQPPPAPPQPPPQQAPPGRGVTPSQQQQMLNMRATGQASLLSANPLIQRALLIQQMQGNLRGFNMATAPVLQQFFPQATRHSLLGPPPVGVSLKPARLAFPGLPFQWQNRTFRKDFPRIPERKREADSSSSCPQSQGTDETGPDLEVSDLKADSKQPLGQTCSQPSEALAESSPDDEPATKRLKSNAEEPVPEETVCLSQVEDSNTESHLEEADNTSADLAADASDGKNFLEELKTSEVVSSAGSLKVTIQQSSESRAISTTALKPSHWTSETVPAETSPESVLKFYCYICKTDCCNQQNFQAHMAGVQHQQRLQDIQHMSNVCFVSLLPMVKEQRPLVEKDGDNQQRWCNTCQTNFIGDLIKHRRTQDHKLAKRSLRPLCTVCSRHFKTPRKFVEHMKSLEHKQKAKEVRLGEKEQGGPEDSEELITVDAVGCFEEEEEEEEEASGEGEDSELEQLKNEEHVRQVGLNEMSLEDIDGNEKYCADTVYGLDFLVPVAGFLCRLCHKFYHSDSAGRLTHCKSLMHFENLQRYKATRLQATTLVVESPLRPRQEPHDGQTAVAAKMVDKTGATSTIKEATVQAKSGGSPREELAFAAQSSSSETDDVRSTLAIGRGDDARNRLLDASEISIPAKGDVLGLCGQKMEHCCETPPEAAVDTASGDEMDFEASDGPEVQDQEKEIELSSLAGTASAVRRSARRRAR